MEEEWHEEGRWKHEPNDSSSSEGTSGLIAWGQSYLLQVYLLMYRAHEDPIYLDKFTDNADAVLANRDSERGVADWRDKSLPAWRADYTYTVGKTMFADALGRPALEARLGLPSGDDVVTVVSTATEAGKFALEVTHGAYGW